MEAQTSSPYATSGAQQLITRLPLKMNLQKRVISRMNHANPSYNIVPVVVGRYKKRIPSYIDQSSDKDRLRKERYEEVKDPHNEKNCVSLDRRRWIK